MRALRLEQRQQRQLQQLHSASLKSFMNPYGSSEHHFGQSCRHPNQATGDSFKQPFASSAGCLVASAAAAATRPKLGAKFERRIG